MKMTDQNQTFEIVIQDADYYNWHDAKVTVYIEYWMNEDDVEVLITEKAINYCSRNGLNYETWCHL